MRAYSLHGEAKEIQERIAKVKSNLKVWGVDSHHQEYRVFALLNFVPFSF